MKKRSRQIIIGVLVCGLLTCCSVYAKQITEAINVTYDNIRILIDGKEYQPTDANGNAVEPFIYNGTTYLPVRAIANAFDKDVDWEAQTSTVTLGSKNYNWLDQMGIADYKTTGVSNSVGTISEKTEMMDGMVFDRGLMFALGISGDHIKNDNNEAPESWQSTEYLLNGNYKDFTGTIVIGGNYGIAQHAVIKFYGDGKLIYTSPFINEGTKSTPFTVDVSGYKVLKITAELPSFSQGPNYYIKNVGIADARLSKR